MCEEEGFHWRKGGIIGALGGTVSGTDTKNTPTSKPGNGAEKAGTKGGQTIPNQQKRATGRVTGTVEQFAQAYRAKRNPSATDAEVREQFELFSAYASGQDTVETGRGVMTRTEIREKLKLGDKKLVLFVTPSFIIIPIVIKYFSV